MTMAYPMIMTLTARATIDLFFFLALPPAGAAPFRARYSLGAFGTTALWAVPSRQLALFDNLEPYHLLPIKYESYTPICLL